MKGYLVELDRKTREVILDIRVAHGGASLKLHLTADAAEWLAEDLHDHSVLLRRLEEESVSSPEVTP